MNDSIVWDEPATLLKDFCILILNLPKDNPYIFYVLAFAWSAIQCYAGYRYGLYIFDNAYREAAGIKPIPSRSVRLWAYAIPHSGLYVICSLTGFIAWSIAARFFAIIYLSELKSMLISLAILAFLGVSGALPRILYLGRKPL